MTSVDLSETANWQNHEIESLLNIWSKKDIQNELGNMHQNLPVYEKISSQLSSMGINRSAISCRDKIKKLKFKYRRIREKKGYRKNSFKFFDILRSVLGDSVEEGGDGYPQHVPHQPRPHSHHGDHANGHGSHYYPQEYDKSRFSPSVVSNDNNSMILSDSESDSEYDYVKGDLSDDDYLHEEMSSQYSEAQPTPSATQQTAGPMHDSGGAGSYSNMFMHGGPSRFPKSNKTDSVPKDDPASFWQQMNTGPLNAARMAMSRRAECMRGGSGFDRGFGMMHHHHPFMGRGHGWRRGGGGGGRKRARLEQTFDMMLNKVSQIQKDMQDRFLSTHEKQHQQHLNFELQRQELDSRHREMERKHEMNMFQMMVSSLHHDGNHLNHALGNDMAVNYSSTPNSPQTSFPGSRKLHTMSQEEVKATWRTADIVCFDVDSTVCKDEGLDELAAFCGVGEKVAAWTRKAMGGDVSFRVALSERLNIVKPSKQQLNDFVANHPPQLSDGMSDLVRALRQKGRTVYLVSGGFRSIIEPAADLLSIPAENIYANKLKFYYTGEYAGFDESQPTSDSGGKPHVMQIIKDCHKDNKLVMIGDGSTDLEAAPPADAFIGYGGNVVRESVKSRAAWFVTDFQELITELNSSS
ncbi:uncharacterized protein [Haliotis cracherodii]|uniref:uncharacterized protein n=1 Tax=Haliotis cracherodii TaxID=6455 RepID=UPI0039EA0F77